MTDLDPIQNQAVQRALRLARKGGAFKLLGKAGTGKTTTGLAIVNTILETGRNVICCAFTNKAVNRMKQVGYPSKNCRTIHRLLYQTALAVEVDEFVFSEKDADFILRADLSDAVQQEDVHHILIKTKVPTDQYENIVKLLRKGRGSRTSATMPRTQEQLEKDGIDEDTVIVVDELSMVPLDDADLLHSMFKTVIFIGDPGQIPPVNSVDTCKYLGCDDEVELTTIHRVSGNEHLLDIIYELDAGKIPVGSEAITIEKFHAMSHQGYQFICYTNDGVAWMNEECRRVLEKEGEPKQGEPLITVTRAKAERSILIDDQNMKWFLDNEARLVGQLTTSRGQRGAVYNRDKGELISVTMIRMIQKNMILECQGSPDHDGDDFYRLPVIVDGEQPDRVWVVKTIPFWKMKRGRKKAFRKLGNSMSIDFSYAITAHKAQGSEWPKVAVMLRQVYKKDMGQPEVIDEISRWNYTAGTRAREDVQLFTSIIGCPYG